MAKWTEQEMESAIEQVYSKAENDGNFRKLCLNDAGAAIKQVTGKDIDAGYKIKFVEADPAFNETWALPPFKADADQLSDADMDVVAGGGGDKNIG